jgi:hypothetical protein
LGTGVGVQEVHVFVGKADTHFHTVILPTVVPLGQGDSDVGSPSVAAVHVRARRRRAFGEPEPSI